MTKTAFERCTQLSFATLAACCAGISSTSGYQYPHTPMREEKCFISPFIYHGHAFEDSAMPSRCQTLSRATCPARKSCPISRKCYACTGRDNQGISRRAFAVLTVASVVALSQSSSSLAQGSPRRTIFDEERELNEKARKEAEEGRIGALRAAFDAVQKASEQLGDLQSFVEEENWDRVRQFTRLFNNSVEREGMEAIAKKLGSKTDRKAALAVGKELTDALIQVDRCAREKDRDHALVHVQEARDIISKFQSFKP